MIALLQRVTGASVRVAGEDIARIESGLLVLVGVVETDAAKDAQRLAARMLDYRIFPDAGGKMNRSVIDTAGEVLLVPQFTLAADTRRGLRPSFARAAPPQYAEDLFNVCVQAAESRHNRIACGRFGADMQVQLTNDGPVTFWLES